MNAWQEVHSSVTVPQKWRAIHYDFDAPLDIFVVLDLLDRVQAGVSRAVVLVPPASTWSRARHFGPIKCPLRTRAHPLGLPSLATSAQSKVHDANLAVEVSTWFAAEALECKTRAVSAVLLFPEDLAGHSVSGPASPWCLKEWRELDGLGEARRGSAFSCRFAGADQQRPIGLLSNIQSLNDETFPGWPVLFLSGRELLYDGPLPRSCGCSRPHQKMVGLSDNFVFNSSSVQGLPYGFWLRIWKDLSIHGPPSCLRHGSLRSSSVVPASPSISSFSGSLSWVYGLWKKSGLTRVHLRELGAADDVDKFCSGKPDLFVFPSLRSSLTSRCSFCVLGSVPDPLVPGSPVSCSGGRVPPVGCRRVGVQIRRCRPAAPNWYAHKPSAHTR